jgi:hypothetical protein
MQSIVTDLMPYVVADEAPTAPGWVSMPAANGPQLTNAVT